MALAPYEPGTAFKPPYYRPIRPSKAVAPDADIWDVVHAFGIDEPFRAMAMKYLARAGCKEGESERDAITKAMEFLQRRLLFLEAEANR